jgi:DNA-directed RNA polymerase subunit RPC12/RpoP
MAGTDLGELTCRRCGGRRLMPLTYELWPEDGGHPGSGAQPERPSLKCLDCGDLSFRHEGPIAN